MGISHLTRKKSVLILEDRSCLYSPEYWLFIPNCLTWRLHWSSQFSDNVTLKYILDNYNRPNCKTQSTIFCRFYNFLLHHLSNNFCFCLCLFLLTAINFSMKYDQFLYWSSVSLLWSSTMNLCLMHCIKRFFLLRKSLNW